MKHKLFSRFCSLFLVLTLTASLTVPALAADGEVTAPGGSDSGTTDSGNGTTNENSGSTSAPQLTGFSVSLPATTSVTLGDSSTLTPEIIVQPEGADVPDDIDWSYETRGINSDTVPFTYTTGADGSVILNPTTVGTARLTVTAKSGGMTSIAECLVEVIYAPAKGITVLPTGGVVLDINKTQLLSAYLTPSATTDPASVKWTSSNPNVVQLSATTGQQMMVTASKPGVTTITATAGSASTTCDVTVRGIVISAESPSMMVGKTQQLTATPYETDSLSIQWSSGNESVAIVNSATGEVTALGVGSAVITATAGSYSATYYISVTENTAASIKLDVEAGQPVSFGDILSSKLNSVCSSMLSSSLDYITNLTAATNEGTLYYGYASESSTGLGVGVTELYHYRANAALGERALDGLTFVPRNGFVGTATIYYTARSVTGATFSGQIALTVETSGDVTYTTPSNTPVTFMVADFIDVCRTKTSSSLNYLTFTLPSSARGTLYYKYSETALYSEPVSAGTKYRVSGTPQLSDITFVPADHYTGTVTIPYTAVSTAGISYSGKVTIMVTGNTTSWDEVTYRVSKNGFVTFKASDFNSACIAAGGSTLSYVRFILPGSNVGTLYYDYSSNRNYDSLVSYDTRYYYKSDPCISDITFVAGSEFSETAFIDFIAFDTSGRRYFCKICIEPAALDDNSPAFSTTLQYNAKAGHFVTFNAEDFNEVSLNYTGSPLSYVKFELPASSRGTLYYNYNGTAPSKVSANSMYYRSSSLSKVSFVPNSTFSGTVSINYVGRTTSGVTFDGVVRVSVTKGKDLTIVRTTASGGSVPLSETDFNTVCYALTGETLNYIRFTLPASNRGTLYYDYKPATGKYASKVTSTTNYYHTAKGTYKTIDKVSFLSNSSYTGTVDIPFTGWSSSTGTKITGTLRIIVTDPTADTIAYTGTSSPLSFRTEDFNTVCEKLMGRKVNYIRFTSLPDRNFGRLYLNYTSPAQPGTAVTTGQSYYTNGTPALSNIVFVPKAGYEGTITLYYTGKDTSGTGFNGTITLTISNKGRTSSYTDMNGHSDAIPAVEFLSYYGIISGYQGQFNPEGRLTRGDFALMVCCAFGLNTGNRVSFSDVPEDSYYAWAIATLKDLGVVQGNGNLFSPKNPLSKEDAITLLYRVLNVAGIELPTASTYLLAYYADGDQVSDYARQAVATLLANGIADADGSNQISPKLPIRRAELAIMVHRVLTH